MSPYVVELRRSGTLLLVVALPVVGVVLTLSHTTAFSNSWAGAAYWVSQSGIVLGPMAAVVCAWVGGRERRRRLTELLSTTPRPTLSRSSVTAGVLLGGALLGMVLVAGFVAIGIARAVSYGGGRWPVSMTLAVVGVPVCAAIGFAAGRLVPGRLVAPLVGVLIYVVTGVFDYLLSSATRLDPVYFLPSFEYSQLKVAVALLDAAWLGALTLTLVLLAGRSRLCLVAGIAALGLGIGLAQVPTDRGTRPDGWTSPDPAAARLVCTRDEDVCLTQVHAGLLPSVAPPALRLLASARLVLPVDHVVELTPTQQRSYADGALPLDNLTDRSRVFSAAVAQPERLASDTAQNLTIHACDSLADADVDVAYEVDGVAAWLIGGQRPDLVTGTPGAAALHRAVAADPDHGRAWVTAALSAGRRCDVAAYRRLAAVR